MRALRTDKSRNKDETVAQVRYATLINNYFSIFQIQPTLNWLYTQATTTPASQCNRREATNDNDSAKISVIPFSHENRRWHNPRPSAHVYIIHAYRLVSALAVRNGIESKPHGPGRSGWRTFERNVAIILMTPTTTLIIMMMMIKVSQNWNTNTKPFESRII